MTDEERFRFDLTGFLVRPAVFPPDEVAEMVEHIRRMTMERDQLPPAHRYPPGGPLSRLIDHPQIVDVLREVIGPELRINSSYAAWRRKGEAHELGLHRGGVRSDPIFGYRVVDGRINAGMVRVIVELSDVGRDDGGTHFLVGSHKADFKLHPDHLKLAWDGRSEFLHGYECPAGSVVFFTENVAHGGPEWRAEHPRVAVFTAYTHVAICHHLGLVPSEVVEGLPREKQAYFRQPWLLDFRDAPGPVVTNTVEHYVQSEDSPLDLNRPVKAAEV